MAEQWSVIDADIHPVLDDRRVLDFLPEPWQTRYAGGNRGPGVLGYWNPNGVMRADAVTEDGARIEGDPKLIGSTAGHFFSPHTAFLNADGLSVVLSFLNKDSDSEVVATPRAVTRRRRRLSGAPTFEPMSRWP